MRKSLLVIAAAIGLALAAVAGADVFTASPQLRIAKVPEGTTNRGATVFVYGRIVSSRAFCKANRRVRLFRVRPGPDRFLGSDLTDREGEYRFVRRPRAGPDGLHVHPTSRNALTYGHSHVCRSDRSRNLRINVEIGRSLAIPGRGDVPASSDEDPVARGRRSRTQGRASCPAAQRCGDSGETASFLLLAVGLLNGSRLPSSTSQSAASSGPSEYGALAALLAVAMVLSVPFGVVQTVVAQRTASLRPVGRGSEAGPIAAETLKALVPVAALAALVMLVVGTPVLALFLHVDALSASLFAPYTFHLAARERPARLAAGRDEISQRWRVPR